MARLHRAGNSRAVFAALEGAAWSDSDQWENLVIATAAPMRRGGAEKAGAIARSHPATSLMPRRGVAPRVRATRRPSPCRAGGARTPAPARGPVRRSSFFSRRASAKAKAWPSKSRIGVVVGVDADLAHGLGQPQLLEVAGAERRPTPACRWPGARRARSRCLRRRPVPRAGSNSRTAAPLMPADSTFFASGTAAFCAVLQVGPVQRHGVAVRALDAGQHGRVLGHLARLAGDVLLVVAQRRVQAQHLGVGRQRAARGRAGSGRPRRLAATGLASSQIRWASFFMRSADGSAHADLGAAAARRRRSARLRCNAVLKSMPLTACSSLKPPPAPQWRQW